MKLLRFLGLTLAVVFFVAMLAACGGDDEKDSGAEATTRAAASPTGGGGGGDAVQLEIAAENTEYDVSELTAPAGADVTLTFDNDDPDLQHNWSLYETEESTEPLFEGERITGVDTIDYEFTAPEDPGTYHFHCDVHPNVMTGDFIVE
jgi:plastocyanin